MRFVTPREACKILGIHYNTLRRLGLNGKIKYYETDTGRRRYDVDSYLGITKDKKGFCYCRVSSPKQRDDLQRQVEYMQEKYPEYEVIKDIGSGLNFKRKGLNTLLEQACQGSVKEVVVAHKDRLARFGFDLIEWVVKRNGGRILVLNRTKESPEQELTADLLAILQVFSCRLHGLRRYSNQIKKDSDLPKF